MKGRKYCACGDLYKLNTEPICFTTTGLHENIHELERQLDGIGYLDEYMAENPEDFLDYCDWMGIPMQAYPTSLDRLKSLLLEQAEKLKNL